MSSNLKRGLLVAGRYRLDSPLGAGGFGDVWRATELASGRPVALKVLKGRIDKVSHTRFEREVEALARIDHPNCVKLEAFGFSDEIGAAYLVTEFLDGQTLDVWAQRGHSVEVIVDVAGQIASALDAAHRGGIVHRDLKPANVMMLEGNEGPVVKVLDFGIARMLGVQGGDITKTGEVIGTVGYMSPEQLRGQRDIGPPTDMYCLGVLLFELLEGRPLFTGMSGLETAMKHLLDEPPRLTRPVPPALASLVSKLLRKAPEDRPRTLEAMRVLGALSGRTVGAERVIETSAPRSSPTWIALGAVGILVLVGIWLMMPATPAPTKRPALPRQVLATRPEPEPAVLAKPVSRPNVEESATNSPGCGIEQTAGLHHSFVVGLDRFSTHTYLPKGYDAQHAYPIVLLFHGAGSDPAGIMRDARRDDFADKHGVILTAISVARNLSPSRAWTAWQVESAWGDFLSLSEAVCVDYDRVFLFGYQGGGRGVEGLACHYPVAGGITLSHRHGASERSCEPRGPVPRLDLFAMDSLHDPVEGGYGCRPREKAISPLDDQEAETRRRNQCEGEPRVLETHGKSVCSTWDCAVPTVSCHLEGGDGWPNSVEPVEDPECNEPAAKFPLGEVIWRFMESVTEARDD